MKTGTILFHCLWKIINIFKNKSPRGKGKVQGPRSKVYSLKSQGSKFQGFKPRCNDAEQKAWARIPSGTLFERPNVRVRAAAVNMPFVREAAGRVAGRPFFGSFLWSEQRNERKKSFYWTPACAGVTALLDAGSESGMTGWGAHGAPYILD
jgi:hypothetical protein